MRNEEILHNEKEKRNVLHTIKRKNATFISHTLRRNCILKHVIEGKIYVAVRQGRRHKQLLDDMKEMTVY